MDRTKYMSIEDVGRLRTVTQARAVLDLQSGHKQGINAWMLVDLALSTGLRVSEIAALTVADIDLRRGFVAVCRVKKRVRKPESLNIGKDLAAHLSEYLDWRKLCGIDAEALLVGKRGPLTAQGLEILWKRAVATAGLPKEYTIHSARHTCATHLLAKCKNLRQVQKQLGHSSPTITANMYADVTDEDMRAGVEHLYD